MKNEWLDNRQFMFERLSMGIDIYPNDNELKEFQRLAKEYDKERYFTIYGCQDCIRTLVKFVFDNYDKSLKDGENCIDN